jgi:hypothetical protein
MAQMTPVLSLPAVQWMRRGSGGVSAARLRRIVGKGLYSWSGWAPRSRIRPYARTKPCMLSGAILGFCNFTRMERKATGTWRRTDLRALTREVLVP